MTDHTDAPDPAAALFLELLGKARPGMSYVEALANGAHYRAQLGKIEGWTEREHRAWTLKRQGLALLVHLDKTGQVRGVHQMLPHDEVDAFLAQNERYVLTAAWGLS